MTSKPEPDGTITGALAVRLLLFAIGMFAFGFLLVPLYNAFCDITGFGGRTNETPATVEAQAQTDRSVDLEFVTTVNEYAPWKFRSDRPGMTIHPGRIYDATFTAENLSGERKVAQAVPSVTPPEAAKYLKKIDCFCFTTQAFGPHEKRSLPVRFIVDRDLPDYIDTVTLSYTFFDTASVARNAADHPAE